MSYHEKKTSSSQVLKLLDSKAFSRATGIPLHVGLLGEREPSESANDPHDPREYFPLEVSRKFMGWEVLLFPSSSSITSSIPPSQVLSERGMKSVSELVTNKVGVFIGVIGFLRSVEFCCLVSSDATLSLQSW